MEGSVGGVSVGSDAKMTRIGLQIDQVLAMVLTF